MKRFFVFLIVAVLSTPLFALMPPASDEELNRDSDFIVDGAVTDVECTGVIEKHSCALSTGYKATLKIDSVYKGEKVEELLLYFNEDKFFERCVGSPDTIHYVGDAGKYYLRCSKDHSLCKLTHYNGVDKKVYGKRVLPKCKADPSSPNG